MIFTVPDGGNDRARSQKTEQEGQGFRGWPGAKVALYGPDDTMATKLSVGIVPAEDAEATNLRRWLSKDQTDIRDDIPVAEEVLGLHHRGRSQVGCHDRPDYRLPA